MAAGAHADQDIELSRGVRNQLTQQAGKHFVAAEVSRRGAGAAVFSGMQGIDVIAFDPARSRQVYIQVKTRTDSRFVWHMQVPDKRLPEPRDEREFYVFVDLGTGAHALPGYWIAPCPWVQNMIYDHKQAWLKSRGNRARSTDSKHSGIKTEQLERWKDRWDVLRVGLK
jgi:hypothetical protein